MTFNISRLCIWSYIYYMFTNGRNYQSWQTWLNPSVKHRAIKSAQCLFIVWGLQHRSAVLWHDCVTQGWWSPSHDRNDDKILHHGKLTSPRLQSPRRWRHVTEAGWQEPGLMPSAGWIQTLTQHYVIGEKPVPAESLDLKAKVDLLKPTLHSAYNLFGLSNVTNMNIQLWNWNKKWQVNQ